MQVYEVLQKVREWILVFSQWVAPYLPAVVVFAAGVTTVCVVCRTVGRYRARRAIIRAKLEKERAFTLPDRENSFVRERLGGVLKPGQGMEATFDLSAERLRLEYVRKLLSKTKAAPLAVADRLEANRLSRAIAEYAEKDRLSIAETQRLCECFLSVLKLASKYSI